MLGATVGIAAAALGLGAGPASAAPHPTSVDRTSCGDLDNVVGFYTDGGSQLDCFGVGSGPVALYDVNQVVALKYCANVVADGNFWKFGVGNVYVSFTKVTYIDVHSCTVST
ncbi:hypothetical protein [Kutzneria buriramensis]|uniref:hypothetical protein n=1 Tax=Kutzneria buriramensis TaxID=1045776 RepID=UPI000E28541B|nr:hypothetical protein [Kutzneria buriramensis]